MDRSRIHRWGMLLGATLLVAAGCEWQGLGFDAARTNSAPTGIGVNNLPNLTEAWTATVGQAGGPVATNSVVVVGSADGSVRAFDKRGVDGCGGAPKVCQPLWTANVGGPALTPTVAGDKAYVTGNGKLSVFDTTGTTGCGGMPKVCQPMWTITPAMGSPVVDSGRLYVSTGPTIGAFDANGSTGCGGSPKRCAPLFATHNAPCPGGATVCRFSDPSVAGGVLYGMWSNNGGLGQAAMEAFDADGVDRCGGTPTVCAPAWTTGLRGNDPSPAPAISGGRLFVNALFTDQLSNPPGQKGVTLEALDAATGQLLWIGSSQFGHDKLAVAGNRVYAGGVFVDIFDASGVQSCHPVSGVNTCNPVITLTAPDITEPIALANGVLYASGIAGVEGSLPHFKAYDVSKLTPSCGTNFGSCVPDFEASTISTASTDPAIVDGFAYVTSGDGKLHAFSLP